MKGMRQKKKVKYAQRVINVEKGTFCPLVYSTFGGTAPDCTAHHKRVAQIMSFRRSERYEDVINFIRTKVRFEKGFRYLQYHLV